MVAILGAGEVAALAAIDPDGTVLAVDGGDDLSYGAWEERSNAVGRGLAARGVVAGDRVGLLFDGSHWADFAVAHLGARKAGAVPVLLSSGAAAVDRARAVAHAGVVGVLCAPGLVVGGADVWVADPVEVGRGQSRGALAVAAQAGDDVAYPAAALARPCPVAPAGVDLGVDGWLVHAWAPGSLGSAVALRLAGRGSARLATVSVFDPDRFCAEVARRSAPACGLTPALAAAVVASGALRRHAVGSVRQVSLTGRPSAGLRDGLAAAFGDAAVVEVGVAPAPPSEVESAPVAVSQAPMLWHEQFAPGSFNLPCLVRRYQGRLDVDALRQALSEIVRRHQPLRSTFELVDGDARQLVWPPAALALPVVDVGDRAADVDELIAEAGTTPFDLVAGPLFEPRLVRLGPEDHVLVIRLHHTVFDDWSVDVFRRELSALYTAAVDGTPSPLVEPPVTFAGAARRQQARTADDAERDWWRAELDGGPLAVQLPLGRGTGEADEPVHVDLPVELAAAIRSRARQLRATPFMTVLGAFSLLVSEVTGQDDVVLATVVANRNQADVEPLIGCSTKKVPVRLRLRGAPTFAEVVARTRSSLLGALSHQDIGFDAAVQAGVGEAAADHGVVPHLAVVFQGETPRQASLTLPGLTVTGFDTGAGGRAERHFSARAEAPAWGDGMYLGTFLIVSLVERAEGMGLVARGVFDRPAARRLLDEFVALLERVVHDPSANVGERAVPLGCDVVDVRGFRADRHRLEEALRRCPGVVDVALAVPDDDGDAGRRLVAHVVPGADPPTLAQIRAALWAEVPGVLWPADAVFVKDLASLAEIGPCLPGDDDPLAVVLAAMWTELRGRPAGPGTSYWQDFTFLPVLAEAREAGLAIADGHVVRCRTPATLAAALRASTA